MEKEVIKRMLHPPTPKPSPCAQKTQSIHESLRKIKEQLEAIPIIDLTGIQEQLDDIKQGVGTLIILLERKVELDEKEAIIMDLLKAKMEKG